MNNGTVSVKPVQELRVGPVVPILDACFLLLHFLVFILDPEVSVRG